MIDFSLLPKHVQDICRSLTEGLANIFGDKLYALYAHGASIDPLSTPTGDVDFHALLVSRLSNEEISDILSLHKRIADEYPRLGAELDIYYILLADAFQDEAPTHMLNPSLRDHSWALHRAHVLAGRCVVLHGPSPSGILESPTWSELERSLQGELRYVQNHLKKYPDYCILNLCRLIYSFTTRDVVVSKRESADWALSRYPDWQRHIMIAMKSYSGLATDEEIQFIHSQINDFYTFACNQISQYH